MSFLGMFKKKKKKCVLKEQIAEWKEERIFMIFRFKKVEWKAMFLKTETRYDSPPKASLDFLNVSYFTQKN